MKTFSPVEIEALHHLLEKPRSAAMEELGKDDILPLTNETNLRISVEELETPIV